MPRIRRSQFPRALLRHLADRVVQRAIGHAEVVAFSRWVDTDPEVPEGRWFKRLPGVIVCGEGELVKTFLRAGGRGADLSGAEF